MANMNHIGGRGGLSGTGRSRIHSSECVIHTVPTKSKSKNAKPQTQTINPAYSKDTEPIKLSVEGMQNKSTIYEVSPETITTFDVDNITEAQQTIIQRILNELCTAPPHKIRDIGFETQAQLIGAQEQMFEVIKKLDNAVISKNMAKLQSVAKKVAHRRLPFIKVMQPDNSEMVTHITALTNSIEQDTQRLNTAMDIMQEVLQQVEKLYNYSELVIYAFQQHLAEDSETPALTLQPSSIVQHNYSRNEKEFRLQELQTQKTIAQQQLISAQLIMGANQAWVHELSHAVKYMVPLYQVNILQRVGLEANKHAARTIQALRKTVNTSLIDMSTQLSENIEHLQTAHSTQFIEVSTLRQVENNLLEIHRQLKRGQSAAQVKNKDAQRQLEAIGQLLTVGAQHYDE